MLYAALGYAPCECPRVEVERVRAGRLPSTSEDALNFEYLTGRTHLDHFFFRQVSMLMVANL